MRLRAKKAQSVLEYTIILAAIIAAVIVGANAFNQKVQSSMGTAGTMMDSSASALSSTLSSTGGGTAP